MPPALLGLSNTAHPPPTPWCPAKNIKPDTIESERDRDIQLVAGAAAGRSSLQLQPFAHVAKPTTQLAGFYASITPALLLASGTHGASETRQRPRFAVLIFSAVARLAMRRMLPPVLASFQPQEVAASGWPRPMLAELLGCKTPLDYRLWTEQWVEYLSGRKGAEIKAIERHERRQARKKKRE